MRIALRLVVLLISIPLMMGQSPPTPAIADLTVLVLDPSGALIPNADVVFKGEKDVVTKTSPAGVIKIPLPFGTYDITVSIPGFKTAKYVRFPVDAAHQSLEVVLQLQPCFDCGGDPREDMVVPTTTSDVPNVLDPKEFERLLGPAGGSFKLLPLSSAPAHCPKNQPKTEAALVQLEQRWAAALGQHDADTVACMLADEFEEADVDGSLHLRGQVLEHIPQRKPGSNHLVEVHVHVDGNFGYVRGLNEVQDPDGNVKARVRFTDVFTYRNGRWQAILAHESLVSEASR